MNKKFTNRNIKQLLDESVVIKLKMGSKFYGTSHEESDDDWLCIYLPPENQLKSLVQGATQLQWKDEFGDINYTDILTFTRNLISGDNTVNVESLYNKDFLGTDLEFFYINRKQFITYNVLKSYLGLCKRDLNEVTSISNWSDKIKKFIHAYRGFLFYKNLSSGADLFDNFVIQRCRDKKKYLEEWLNDYVNFKLILNQNINELSKEVENERSSLNKKLDSGLIKKTPSVSFQENIDEFLNKYLSTLRVIQQQKKYIDLSLFYTTE